MALKNWKPWQRILLLAVVGIAVLYLVYGAFVALPNGHHDNVYLALGTGPVGGMYLRCANGNDPAVCRAGADGNAEIFVHSRDRVTFHIHNDDGGSHTHDFRLEGTAYWLWPAHAETELHKTDESVSFTAWKTGTFRIICELSGHDAAGMHAVLHVNTSPK